MSVGKDATEAFEDIGHSDEAREILEKYLIGELDEAVSIEKREVCFASIDFFVSQRARQPSSLLCVLANFPKSRSHLDCK